MSRRNRRDIFDPDIVGVYHCIQRTVRRAWLCGLDVLTGKSFEHRRTWIQDRLEELAAIFAFDCLTFAILSNHIHTVIRNRPDIAATWSDLEVARRWWYYLPKRRDANGRAVEPTEEDLKPLLEPEKNQKLRRRLQDISWFMRALAEPIARRSNAEDECTGRFWEGRFKSQKLVDEASILACSLYVDLNPIRAGMAGTPEESLFTSIFERIASEREVAKACELAAEQLDMRSQGLEDTEDWEQLFRERETAASAEPISRRDAWLAPIELDERAAAYAGPQPASNGKRASDKGFLSMPFRQYLQLLDWTGRQLRGTGEHGRIPAELAPVLARLGLSQELWCDLVGRFGKIFKSAAGGPIALAQEAARRGQRWLQTNNSPLAKANPLAHMLA